MLLEKMGVLGTSNVPFLVWAYREVPNATTGVAPYTMLYGRLPRGPLAILKKSWAGET